MTPNDRIAKALNGSKLDPESIIDIEEAEQSAEGLSAAFEVAGDRIAGALDRAARTGEISFSQMAESVARDLARLAVQSNGTCLWREWRARIYHRDYPIVERERGA